VTDVVIEEISPEDSRRVAIKFIEKALETLQDPKLKDHDIEHAIFDLNTALSFLA
jgi:hypothetical protein